jgi:SAM-dependent methyltransferase
MQTRLGRLGRKKKAVATDFRLDGATKLLLHVGCGPRGSFVPPELLGAGWREVRLDIDPGVEPDIVASLDDMSPVEAGSMDALWSYHNLEHVFAHQVPLALREFARVLRPGSPARIAVPDLQAAAALIAAGKLEDAVYDSPHGPIAALDMVYGLRPAIAEGKPYMAHRTGFTARTLRRHLREAGFEEVDVARRDGELSAVARKPG